LIVLDLNQNYLKVRVDLEFIPFNNILANDSAWAVRLPYGPDREKEMENVTDCTALDNGWVWNIPLWNRIGTGYVFLK